eukprot:TRINITY_DN1915_c0_g1_i1.p1 TRINITY_DN1915_c0_g1~~TRINITY_DN1915_c0_g1_i1.p1  ORF type:complete len:362 (-),score=96.43 TRINITY_DN1915_c0_g1_i1:574-1659(-)
MVSVIVPSSYGLGSGGGYGSYPEVMPGKPQTNHTQPSLFGCVFPRAFELHPAYSRRPEPGKGSGGPPVLRSGRSNYSQVVKPLFVDCSVEYELPNVPKVPDNSLPLLVIHPGYSLEHPKKQQQRGSRKREAEMMSSDPPPQSSTNIHSLNPQISYSLSVKRNMHNISDTHYSSTTVPSSSVNSCPPQAKRCRSDWLRETQELKAYQLVHHQQQEQDQQKLVQQQKLVHHQQQKLVQQQKLAQQQKLVHHQHQKLVQQQKLAHHQKLVQQQQNLWRLNSSCQTQSSHQHSWTSCQNSCCCNKYWLAQQQQQLYAKQQQAYYQQQQQLLRTRNSCPDCLNGKCLFAWNKENSAAASTTSLYPC